MAGLGGHFGTLFKTLGASDQDFSFHLDVIKAKKSFIENYRFQFGILIENREVRSGVSCPFPSFSYPFRPLKARRGQVWPGLARRGLSGRGARPRPLSPEGEGVTRQVRMGLPWPPPLSLLQTNVSLQFLRWGCCCVVVVVVVVVL